MGFVYPLTVGKLRGWYSYTPCGDVSVSVPEYEEEEERKARRRTPSGSAEGRLGKGERIRGLNWTGLVASEGYLVLLSDVCLL